METPFSSGSFLSTQFMSANQMQYFPDRGYLTQPEMGNFRQTPGPQYPQMLNRMGFMGAMYTGYQGTNTMDNYVMGADSHKFTMMARRKVQDSTAAMAGSILDQALKMAVGGIATVATGGNILAGMAAYSMTPSITAPFTDRLRQARNIQYQTMGKVIGGPDMDQGLGQGFSLQAAGRMDQSIRRMAASDPMLKEKDYRKLMEMGIEGGMFDYSLSSAQYTGKLKNLIGNFKAMMEMLETADPKLIQDTMTRLQRMGASTDQMIPMVAKEQLAARMLGIQHSEMINTYGQQGAMLYGAAGLTPYAGTHENIGNVANAALAQRLGLLSPGQAARLGGIGGIGQSATQDTANILNSTAAQGVMYSMLNPETMEFDPNKLKEVLDSRQNAAQLMNKGVQAYADITKHDPAKAIEMAQKMAANKAKLAEYLSQEGLSDEFKMRLWESVGSLIVSPGKDAEDTRKRRVRAGMYSLSDLPLEQQNATVEWMFSPEFKKAQKDQKIVNDTKREEALRKQELQKEARINRLKVWGSEFINTWGERIGSPFDMYSGTDGFFGTKAPAQLDSSWSGGIGTVFGTGGGGQGPSGRNLVREITGRDATKEELELLALMVWKEARGLPQEGQDAVIHSAINRLNDPGRYGTNLEEVILKPKQYSSMTVKKDKQYNKVPMPGDKKYEDILKRVQSVIAGDVENPFPGADSFHDTSIMPNWTPPVGQISNMIYYNESKKDGQLYGPRVTSVPRRSGTAGQMDMSWVNEKAPVEFRATEATWMEARSVGSQAKGLTSPTDLIRGHKPEDIIEALVDAVNGSDVTTASGIEDLVVSTAGSLLLMSTPEVKSDPAVARLIEIALSRVNPRKREIIDGVSKRYNVKNTESYMRGVNKVQRESLGTISTLSTSAFGGGIRDMLGKSGTSNALEVLTALTMSKSLDSSAGKDRASNEEMLDKFLKEAGLEGLTKDILADPKKLEAFLKSQGWSAEDINIVGMSSDEKSRKVGGKKKAFDALPKEYKDAKEGYAKGTVAFELAQLETGLRNAAGITEDGSLIDKLFGDGGKDRAKSLMDSLGKDSKAYSVLDEISKAKSKEEFLNTTKHLDDLDEVARGKGNVPSDGRNNAPTKVEQDQLDLGKQTKEVLSRLDLTLGRVETELKIMNEKKVGPFKNQYGSSEDWN